MGMTSFAIVQKKTHPLIIHNCATQTLSTALTAASFICMRVNYVGIPVHEIPLEWDIKRGFIWTYISQVLYNPALGLIKSSILFFLLRLGHQKPGVKFAIHALNASNLAMLVAIFFATLLQCKPISWFWESVCPEPIEEGSPEGKLGGLIGKNTEKGECVDQVSLYMMQAVWNILTDILTLALPFWIFLGLNMPGRLKRATLCIFGLGVVVPVVSIMRFVFLYLIFHIPIAEAQSYSMSFVLSAVELNLAIVCACAPTLWGLRRVWFTRFFVTGGAGGEVNGNGETRGVGMTARTSQTWRYSTHRYGARAVEDVDLSESRDGAPIGGTGSSHLEASALGLVGGGGGGRLGLTPSEEEIMVNYGIVTKGEGGGVVLGTDLGYRESRAARDLNDDEEIELVVEEEVGNARKGAVRGGIRQHSRSSSMSSK
ncbi:hypothetical protein QBC43DRAFT_22275 [Cladorrhinum sp. PSN259]|nr:hypothetical protein QBC43DRAFT_22275 [Cladorrhinum sp. PSN259]